MNPTTIGMIVFTCTFGGAMLGMWLRTTLPKHHLDADSKETVNLCVGLIATMTAPRSWPRHCLRQEFL